MQSFCSLYSVLHMSKNTVPTGSIHVHECILGWFHDTKRACFVIVPLFNEERCKDSILPPPQMYRNVSNCIKLYQSVLYENTSHRNAPPHLSKAHPKSYRKFPSILITSGLLPKIRMPAHPIWNRKKSRLRKALIGLTPEPDYSFPTTDLRHSLWCYTNLIRC